MHSCLTLRYKRSIKILSGAIWSAQLAACMLTIFDTLKIWGINPHTWLLTYFYECAMNSGIPPDNVDHYLPWHMPQYALSAFLHPPKHQQPIADG